MTRLSRSPRLTALRPRRPRRPTPRRTAAPDALVRKSIDEVLALIKADKDLQGGNPQKLYALVEEKVLPHFDFTRMTRLAVGRNWAQASDAQKEALTREFRTLLVRTYSTSLSQYRNQTIDVKPAKIAAGDKETVVKTVVNQPGGQSIPIDYGMERTDKGWKVYDVVVDGVSLVTTYRGSFNDQIQKSGIDGLVKTLADRNRSPEAPKAAVKVDLEEVNAGKRAEVLALEGALSFETLPRGAGGEPRLHRAVRPPGPPHHRLRRDHRRGFLRRGPAPRVAPRGRAPRQGALLREPPGQPPRAGRALRRHRAHPTLPGLSMAGPAVEVRDASKRYGAVRALDGVSLTVEEGEFFALLGPNGAGKTTLISALGGLVRPDSGTLRVMGHDVAAEYQRRATPAGHRPAGGRVRPVLHGARDARAAVGLLRPARTTARGSTSCSSAWRSARRPTPTCALSRAA